MRALRKRINSYKKEAPIAYLACIARITADVMTGLWHKHLNCISSRFSTASNEYFKIINRETGGKQTHITNA